VPGYSTDAALQTPGLSSPLLDTEHLEGIPANEAPQQPSLTLRDVKHVSRLQLRHGEEFVEYAGAVFGQLRAAFGITDQAWWGSLSGDPHLVQMPS
jgi:hypothetical protein